MIGGEEERRWTKAKFSCLVFSILLKVSGAARVDLVIVNFSRSFSYTLCTGGHFEPAQSLTKKYYRTSWYISFVLVEYWSYYIMVNWYNFNKRNFFTWTNFLPIVKCTSSEVMMDVGWDSTGGISYFSRGVARISRKGGLGRRKECARSARKIFGLTTPTNYITLAGTKGGLEPAEPYASYAPV